MRVPRPAARMTALVLGVAAVMRLGDRRRLMEVYWATSESGGLYGRLRDRVKPAGCGCAVVRPRELLGEFFEAMYRLRSPDGPPASRFHREISADTVRVCAGRRTFAPASRSIPLGEAKGEAPEQPSYHGPRRRMSDTSRLSDRVAGAPNSEGALSS